MILPTIIDQLQVPQALAVWPVSAFSLVPAAFLLPFGRLVDMYGGYPVYLGGLTWWFVWSVVAGFSHNATLLILSRALQGLGASATVSAAVMLLGSYYRPGPRKNLVFSIYGGTASLGFFSGIFCAGLTGQFLYFGWYFWIGAILLFTSTLSAYFTVPSDIQEHRGMNVNIDWLGSTLIISGLILLVFAITESSHAPNPSVTPYVYPALVVGTLLLSMAVYVEGWAAKNPLIPFSLFHVPYLGPLAVALFLNYGVLAIYLLYATLYMQNIMGATPLQVALWYSPMCMIGIIIGLVGGFVLHLIPGTFLIILSGVCWIMPSLLFSLAPVGANYWVWVFPAMVFATGGVDITYTVTNIFITNSLPHEQQGLAGALINSLYYLGSAFLLGFAEITRTQTTQLGLKRSYQSVFWFESACALIALVITVGFVRIAKAKSSLTVEERMSLGGATEQTSLLSQDNMS